MMKRLTVCALVALLVLASVASLAIAPASAAGEKTYFADEAGVMNESEAASLNTTLATASSSCGCDIVGLCISDPGTYDNLADYAEYYYTSGGYSDDGIIFVVYYYGDSYRAGFYTCGLMDDRVSSEDAQAIFDEMRPRLNALDDPGAFRIYSERCVEFATSTGAALAGAPGDLVVDLADILTDSEERELRSYLKEKSQKAGADIVVVTVRSLGGKSMMAFADDYLDYNGYSKDGILFLRYINGSRKEVWISGVGKMEGRVNEDSVFDAISDDFSRGDYLSAFKTYGDMCADATKLPVVRYLIISSIAGLIIAAIHISRLKKQLISVQNREEAREYIVPDSMQVSNSQEIYLYSTVSRVRRESSSSSGGGSHTSSSGRSHSGGGRSM